MFQMEFISLFICMVMVNEIIPDFVHFFKVLPWFFRSKCMSESLTPLHEPLVKLLLQATIMDFKVYEYKIAECLLVNMFKLLVIKLAQEVGEVQSTFHHKGFYLIFILTCGI